MTIWGLAQVAPAERNFAPTCDRLGRQAAAHWRVRKGHRASRARFLLRHVWVMGQTRPRRPPSRRAYARPLLPSKRTHTGRPNRGSLGPQPRHLVSLKFRLFEAAGVGALPLALPPRARSR